jgi:hypothetical protein
VPGARTSTRRIGGTPSPARVTARSRRTTPCICAATRAQQHRTQLYEIRGRSYGVEPNGTVYPVSGTGMVKLDRNEYAALKEIVRAGGDLSAAPQLSRNPRFVDNPEAVAKAKAIYDGTYQP